MRPLVIEPFFNSWKEVFKREKRNLETLFKSIPIVFHHIGSTSIESCVAKPVIDILGVTNDVLRLDAFTQEMEKKGYTCLGEYGMPQRRFFVREEDPQIHLHIFADSDPEVGRHLRFCHYLRIHPEQVEAYNDLKKELANSASSREAYTLGKEKFIKKIDALAIENIEVNVPAMGPRKNVWEKQEILSAMEANEYCQETYWSHFIPSQEVVWQKDVTIVRSTIQDDTFNLVFDAKFEDGKALTRIQEVEMLFGKTPFAWWVGENDRPADLSIQLTKAHYVKKEENIGMYLLLDAFTSPLVNPELQIERILEPAGLEEFCKVFAGIGGYPNAFEEYHSMLPKALYRKGPFEFYIGNIDGKAVCTGLLLLHAHTAGIYWIMTLPEYRRKGLGTAMMLALIERAKRQGYHLATLQASEEGAGLYERLGFQKLIHYWEYAKEFDENV